MSKALLHTPKGFGITKNQDTKQKTFLEGRSTHPHHNDNPYCWSQAAQVLLTKTVLHGAIYQHTVGFNEVAASITGAHQQAIHVIPAAPNQAGTSCGKAR